MSGSFYAVSSLQGFWAIQDGRKPLLWLVRAVPTSYLFRALLIASVHTQQVPMSTLVLLSVSSQMQRLLSMLFDLDIARQPSTHRLLEFFLWSCALVLALQVLQLSPASTVTTTSLLVLLFAGMHTILA